MRVVPLHCAIPEASKENRYGEGRDVWYLAGRIILAVQSLSHVWLRDPMDCSMLGFPVLHHLPELTGIHVHGVGDAIQRSHPLSSPFSSCLQPFPASGSFPICQLFTSGSQSIGASASASVLSMKIQGWFPLGLTGLISLQSKGLSRVVSNTTVPKHQFLGTQLFYSPTLTSIHDYWKNHSLD